MTSGRKLSSNNNLFCGRTLVEHCTREGRRLNLEHVQYSVRVLLFLDSTLGTDSTHRRKCCCAHVHARGGLPHKRAARKEVLLPERCHVAAPHAESHKQAATLVWMFWPLMCRNCLARLLDNAISTLRIYRCQSRAWHVALLLSPVTCHVMTNTCKQRRKYTQDVR